MNLPASEVTRFMFEELDICGAVVRLSDAWRQMHEARDYPHQVQHLLGEMTAVAAMIGSNFKQPGRLTFQAQGQGALSLLVVDCEEVGGQLLLRGMARCAEELAQTPQSLRDLLGEGHLLFSLHGDAAEPPYQSFVALEGHSIAEIFEGFMSQSAQQPARLWLFADETLATGLFLQTLPPRPLATGAVPPDADGWNRVQQLAATLRAGESVTYAASPDRHLYLVSAAGRVRIEDGESAAEAAPRDGVAVKGVHHLTVTALDDSEIVLVDAA